MISVAKNFSRFPAGRYRDDGPFPGQTFRDDILAPALRKGDRVTVDLEGMVAGSSFLDEAFGGLVFELGFSAEELRDQLIIKHASNPSYIEEVWSYIEEAPKPR